jgi:hypothetical protein
VLSHVLPMFSSFSPARQPLMLMTINCNFRFWPNGETENPSGDLKFVSVYRYTRTSS